MNNQRPVYSNVDAYIASFPEHIRHKLQQMRDAIRVAAPDASETISYGMPTFRLHGNLVHFAAYPKHIGFYPTPSGITAFQHELNGYKYAKGSVQFPIDQPLPLDLVSRVVRFRVKENLAAHQKKAKKNN